MFAHLIACTRNYIPAIDSGERARWLWSSLRKRFEHALAVVLMPHHLHMLLLASGVGGARASLSRIMAAFSRRFDLGRLWQPLPPPRVYRGVDKLRRDTRYLHLNPCRPTRLGGRRVRLVSDPLLWPWSTHRDAIGATASPWVSPARMAAALQLDDAQFPRWLHSYVSSEPHVSVEGTPFPQPAPATQVAAFGLARIAVAAATAMRAPMKALRRPGPTRRLFVALARRQGWTDAARLARVCGVQPAAIRRTADDCPPEWVHAGALCLGDARLLPPEWVRADALGIADTSERSDTNDQPVRASALECSGADDHQAIIGRLTLQC